MFKFREQRRLLVESMETVKTFKSKKDLIKHLKKIWGPFRIKVTKKNLKIEPYYFDKRINWNTHIVLLDGNVIGFTDKQV